MRDVKTIVHDIEVVKHLIITNEQMREYWQGILVEFEDDLRAKLKEIRDAKEVEKNA